LKNRLLYYEIIKQLEHKNAIVITGMRQVGKTTLMKQIFGELNSPKLWFDFDNPLDQMLFEDTDYDSIYKRLLSEAGNPHDRFFVFIDEIQNYPQITTVIKYLIDHYGIKFIVTGSSNFYLRNLFPESLSGRKFLFVLFPMSFREYLYFNDNQAELPQIPSHFPVSIDQSSYFHEKYSFLYDQFVEYGGFPEVVTTDDVATKKLILKNIFSSFFEKDLNLLSDIKDIRELRNLILLLIPRTGNILDVTRLSNELGVNRVKMYNYIEFLQGIFFIHLLPRYSKSIDRSVAGGKKVFFSDTGLLNVIGKTTEGQLFENAVANQLMHYGALSYFNKRNTSEIDFILNLDTAIEVKQTGTMSDIIKLEKIAGEIGIEKYHLVSRKYLDQKVFLSPMAF
jgi:uncharacterized protein